MMVTICKQFDFDAAHYLPLLPREHKCHAIHGHTYRVDVMCSGECGEDGMLIDYADIAAVWAPVHALIDHKLLNTVEGLFNPTTEVLAPWIIARMAVSLPCLAGVRVYESSTTWCEVMLAR